MHNWKKYLIIPFMFAAALVADDNNQATQYCPPNWCPPSQQYCNDCGQYGFRAEWLYWHACIEQICFVEKEEGSCIDSAEEETTRENGVCKDKHVCFDEDWDSGFRIGFHYESGCDCWDFDFNWLYYSADSSKTSKGGGHTTVDPFEATGDIVKGRWDLDLTLVDLELGQTLRCGECFHLRPYGGLRYACIDQEFKVRDCSNNPETDKADELASRSVECDSPEKLKYDFDGIGPRLGLKAAWQFGCNWHLFIDGAISLIYGDQDSRWKDSDGSEKETIVDNECSHPIIDLSVGGSWDSNWCDYDFSIIAAWESHYFANLVIQEPDDFASLSTQGLTLGVQVSF